MSDENMAPSALSKVLLKALRRETVPSSSLPAWKRQSLRVYETHQRVFEVILELPFLQTTIDDLSSTDNKDNVITNLKMNLAFVPQVLPTYLPVFQAWCHSFRECDEHTLGSALARSDIVYIDRICEQIMRFVVKATTHLGDLKSLVWLDSKTRSDEKLMLRHSLKLNKAVRDLFYCVDDLYERLLVKVQNTVILTSVQFKDSTETYKYFWEACLLSLDGLRPLRKEWDTLHARFFLWGSGMFQGPMALDKYLRWPESHAPGAEGFKQQIILNSFANILHYSEIELKVLHMQSEIPSELRTHVQLVLARTRDALVKEDLFHGVMISWSTHMSSRVGGGFTKEGYIGTTPVESIGRSMHTLERLGNTLVMERPRALAKREARLEVANMESEQISMRLVDRPVVPILPLRLIATTATTQGQYHAA